MAHITYSPEFEDNRDLFIKMKTKHDADAASVSGSVLTQFLTEQGIGLAADLVLVTDADTANNKFLDKQRLSEELLEKRRVLFGRPVVNLRQNVQFLKKLKRGKVHELGPWGITVDGADRINYPSEFKELKKVVIDFIAKHNSFAAGTSPLQPYLDEHPEIDLVQDLADTNDADTANTDYQAAVADKETFREERDTKMDIVQPHILGIGQFLMGFYNKTPHKLGGWGFNVDESNAKPKDRSIQVGPEAAKTIHDAVLGSVIKISGPAGAQIYSGKTTDGTPIDLPANGTFVIKFRYGTFTIKNNNPTEKVNLNVTVLK